MQKSSPFLLRMQIDGQWVLTFFSHSPCSWCAELIVVSRIIYITVFLYMQTYSFHIKIPFDLQRWALNYICICVYVCPFLASIGVHQLCFFVFSYVGVAVVTITPLSVCPFFLSDCRSLACSVATFRGFLSRFFIVDAIHHREAFLSLSHSHFLCALVSWCLMCELLTCFTNSVHKTLETHQKVIMGI